MAYLGFANGSHTEEVWGTEIYFSNPLQHFAYQTGPAAAVTAATRFINRFEGNIRRLSDPEAWPSA